MTSASMPKRTDADLRFRFNGTEYSARPGETLAAALLRAGVPMLSEPASDARGAFCWMGWCQECRVRHEGRWVEACRLFVHDGLEAHGRRADDAG